MKGTPLVLASVTAVLLLQLLFTYAPVMQLLSRTEALPVATGFQVVAVGALVLLVLESEKALLRCFGLLTT